MQHPSALPPHMRKFRPPLPRFENAQTSLSGKHFGLRRKSERDYCPSKWNVYFTSKQDVHINDGDVFRVYLNENESQSSQNLPLLLLLHGGGFSALTWSVFVKSLVELCHVRIMAIDLRGHGSSVTTNDVDLSISTLVSDITKVLSTMFGESIPELILMGHSMGGALATHFIDKCSDTIANQIIGLIVIDVVEGTAKEALSQMQQVLRSRPPGFKSIQHAIEWCIRSSQVRNLESAKISMPGQIKNSQTGICAADLVESEQDPSSTEMSTTNSSTFGLSTLSENTTNEIEQKDTNTNDQPIYPFVWRINLSQTEPFWMEWFDNLSQLFLSSKGGAKMLLLAGVDRLDGPMTVGQMQGKFQMQILPRVGHIIQEDAPISVAQVVASYLVRNRFSTPKVDFERPFPSC